MLSGSHPDWGWRCVLRLPHHGGGTASGGLRDEAHSEALHLGFLRVGRVIGLEMMATQSRHRSLMMESSASMATKFSMLLPYPLANKLITLP